MSIRERWQNFWFAAVPATDLGASRLLFFLGLTLFYLPHDFSGWGDVSPALQQPIWLFEQFRIPIFGTAALEVIQAVWKLALLFACIGLFTRVSIFVAAVLGTYLLGLGHNFGQTYHFDAILVLAFWILAFSRAGDAFSVDALRRAARHPREGLPAPSAEYRWPIQLVLVALSLVFFAAGFAKLRASGLQWIVSDHLAILLDRVQYRISDADPVLPIGSYIARIPFAAQFMALGTILFETGYPIALFSRRLRPFVVLGGIGLIVGIRLLMGPTFENFLLINLFWVPWQRVGEAVRARLGRQRAVKVLYDGGCGICVPTVSIMARLDLLGRLRFLDVHRDWDRIRQDAPGLTRERCLTDMHVVSPDGRISAGYEAYRELSRWLPLGWLVRPLMHLPPVARLGRRVYRHVADTRQCDWPASPALTSAPALPSDRVSNVS